MLKSPERLRRIFKEGVWIVFGQAMVMIGSLVGVRLLTGLLAPSEYGELSLGLTMATLVNQTILGPLGQGVMRFYAPAMEQGNVSSYLAGVRKSIALATLVIIAGIVVGVGCLWLTGRSNSIAITIASLIFAIFTGYNAILSGIQNSARQRSLVALHQGLEPWLRFLVAALLIGWLGAVSSVAMLGYAVGALIVFMSQSIFFWRVFPHPATWIDRQNEWQQKIWEYSWPMSVFGIFTWCQLVSDRWSLGLFRTTEDVGMYAALFQLGYYPISMATGMLVQFLEPIFFQRAGDGSDTERTANVGRLVWRLTLLALGLTAFAFGFALLFHVQIFEICVAPKYRQISYLFPWMVLSGGIFAASQTITINLLSQANTYKMMPVKILTALLGIALNVVGGYYLGILGLVMASVLFSISCLCSIIIVSRPTKKRS